jgi:hypothetical protein
MIPIKNCHFCLQPTRYVPLSVGDDYSLNKIRILKVHFCHRCRAEYTFWGDSTGELSAVHLYTTINDKMYRWSTSPNDKSGRLWYVEHPGIVGNKPNKGLVLLKNFEDHPDITPANIEEKVRFILPFL